MLDTTILLETVKVPKELTTDNSENVKVDYSTICYIDLEGNVGHKTEVFCFMNYDAFKIDNAKYLDLVALLRSEAEKKFNIILRE